MKKAGNKSHWNEKKVAIINAPSELLRNKQFAINKVQRSSQKWQTAGEEALRLFFSHDQPLVCPFQKRQFPQYGHTRTTQAVFFFFFFSHFLPLPFQQFENSFSLNVLCVLTNWNRIRKKNRTKWRLLRLLHRRTSHRRNGVCLFRKGFARRTLRRP